VIYGNNTTNKKDETLIVDWSGNVVVKAAKVGSMYKDK